VLAGLLSLLCLVCSCCDNASSELDMRTFLLDSSEGFEPAANTSVSVSFKDDEISLGTGCNGHFGSYSVKGGRLIVNSLASTSFWSAR
jgi:heat shock protein HslJ